MIHRLVGVAACCVDGQQHLAVSSSNPSCARSIISDMDVLLDGYRVGTSREVGIWIGIIPRSAHVGRDGDDTRGCHFSSWRHHSVPTYLFPLHGLLGQNPRAMTVLLALCPS